MSEGHGDQPADVRSFLPRPGEPVEQYAERLRALHRDLTLVLQAVERGLAAAANPDDVGPPVPAPAGEPIEIVPEPAEHPAAAAPAPAPRPRSRMPRVEVMPAPSGEQRRDDQEERREPPPAAEPPPRWSKEEEAPRPATSLPPRPSAVTEAPPREPEWVDRGEDFTAPTFPAGAPQRLTVSPLVAVTFVLMWLVVVGLLVAHLVS